MKLLSEKILLLLLSGVALSVCYTPRQYWKTIRLAGRAWKDIDKKEAQKVLNNYYKSKLTKKTKNKDGSTTITITDKGKLKALTYKFNEMQIDKKEWDGKWRLVFFDVPERIRWGRDALRLKVKKLGFYEIQKSVFIFPYDCEDEINFIIEFFKIRKYARFGVLESIDDDKNLKEKFGLVKSKLV